MGDAGSELGTSAPEVWCAANEPPSHIIYIPYFYNKNMEFTIDSSLKGKVRIVAYLPKSGTQYSVSVATMARSQSKAAWQVPLTEG